MTRYVRRARAARVAHAPAEGEREKGAAVREGEEPGDGLLSLAALYPLPPAILLGGDAGAAERWRLEHWGCRSDVEPRAVVVNRWSLDQVEYPFHTVAGAPLKWLERIAEDFPALDFTLAFLAPWEVHGRRACIRGELAYNWGEQPTAEDHARAGFAADDICCVCGEPVDPDSLSCPRCEPSEPGGSGATAEGKSGGAGVGLAGATGIGSTRPSGAGKQHDRRPGGSLELPTTLSPGGDAIVDSAERALAVEVDTTWTNY